MIHSLANRIAAVFVQHGESSEEDADIYAYAVEAILAVLFNVAICLVISFAFGRVPEGVIFISTFALLRRFTGGYHAGSHNKCILTFATLLICAMLLSSFVSGLQSAIFITIAFAVLAWLGILVFAPIDDANKRCEGEHKYRLKKKCVSVSTMMLLICAVVGFSINIYVALIIALSMFSVFGSVVCAIIRRRMA